MFDFLKRIPALLGLKRGGSPPAAPRLKVVGGKALAKDQAAKPPRGRGQGRGVTPPTPASRKSSRPPSRGKK